MKSVPRPSTTFWTPSPPPHTGRSQAAKRNTLTDHGRRLCENIAGLLVPEERISTVFSLCEAISLEIRVAPVNLLSFGRARREILKQLQRPVSRWRISLASCAVSSAVCEIIYIFRARAQETQEIDTLVLARLAETQQNKKIRRPFSEVTPSITRRSVAKALMACSALLLFHGTSSKFRNVNIVSRFFCNRSMIFVAASPAPNSR